MTDVFDAVCSVCIVSRSMARDQSTRMAAAMWEEV